MKHEIRFALPSEADELTALAFRSKSHWPYDEDYLRLCRAATQVRPVEIEQWPFLVAVARGKICGFCALLTVDGENVLDHLWIDPVAIGSGLGRELFDAAVAEAKRLGWPSFVIVSDPYAEAFYLKMGAKRAGERESKVKAGFLLPLLEYNVE